jgi:hypothetical protein
MSELKELLKDGSELQWYARQQFLKKGYSLADLEKGKKLMNLKVERRRNGFYLRLPSPSEQEV